MTDNSPVLILREVADLPDSHTADTFLFTPHVGDNPYSDMELMRSGGGVNLGSIRFDYVSPSSVQFTVRPVFTDGVHPETATLLPGESLTFSRKEPGSRRSYDGRCPFVCCRTLTVNWPKDG